MYTFECVKHIFLHNLRTTGRIIYLQRIIASVNNETYEGQYIRSKFNESRNESKVIPTDPCFLAGINLSPY